MATASEILALVARRASFLECLWEGPATKQELETTLAVSRSTVDRAINELETASLVHKADRNYTLTVAGRVAHQEYRQLIDGYQGLAAAIPLLSYLPDETLLGREVLVGAQVLCPEPPVPEAPLTRFEQRVRHSDEIVGMVPVITQRYVDFIAEQLRADELRLWILLPESIIDHLIRMDPDAVRTGLQTDQCTLRRSAQMPPYSLVIVDWTDVWLGIYDDQGALKGIITTTSPAAVEWAEQRLQQYSEQSTPVAPDQPI